MAQSDLILAALLRGERISKLDAFRMGAGLSINSRIADLRKRGYVIPCEVEMRNGQRVWVYHMVDRSLYSWARQRLGIDGAKP